MQKEQTMVHGKEAVSCGKSYVNFKVRLMLKNCSSSFYI